MKAVVIYESMYGNTHVIAEHIGDGLRSTAEVQVVSVDGATSEVLAGADLIVVGGPTHVHGMTSATSRRGAVDNAAKAALTVDPAATDAGLRDWFDTIEPAEAVAAAAFDTRVDGWPVLTGRASTGIARHLRRSGYRLVLPSESFIVDKTNHLLPNEAERATAWGTSLAESLLRPTSSGHR